VTLSQVKVCFIESTTDYGNVVDNILKNGPCGRKISGKAQADISGHMYSNRRRARQMMSKPRRQCCTGMEREPGFDGRSCS